MLIAVEYCGSVGVGITNPQFFRADDGKTYIVKLQNNRLGFKVLVNEFVAAKLGKIMGLCFPTSSIIEINEQMLQKSQCQMASDISLGRNFASEYLEHAEYVGKHNLHQASNTTEMAGVMLFDHMFHNADRAKNRKNLLIRQEDTIYRIYAIDNSHLCGSGKWTIESLTSLATKIKIFHRNTFGLLLQDYLSPQDFLPYLEKISKFNNETIETIVGEIPNQWLADDLERQELIQYINVRRNMAEEIWETLCKYVPKSRGGGRWLYG